MRPVRLYELVPGPRRIEAIPPELRSDCLFATPLNYACYEHAADRSRVGEARSMRH